MDWKAKKAANLCGFFHPPFSIYFPEGFLDPLFFHMLRRGQFGNEK
jgi:hypothetical protein